MTKAENIIDLSALSAEVALDVTAHLVPSPVGLMDNETARALINEGINLALDRILQSKNGRWEHSIEVQYPGNGNYPGHRYFSGRYRQRTRAFNEMAYVLNPNNRRGVGATGTAKVVRRAIFEGDWEDA